MIRFALPALLLLLGACTPEPTPPLRRSGGPDASLVEECRRQAEREILFRDRGQIGRDDMETGRSDMTNTIPSFRMQAERGNQIMRRDALMEQCIRQNTSGPAPVDARQGAQPARRR